MLTTTMKTVQAKVKGRAWASPGGTEGDGNAEWTTLALKEVIWVLTTGCMFSSRWSGGL